jgi:HK97 family phage prohead protease
MTVMVEKGAAIDLEEKAIADGDDSIIISGYASTFGNVDHGGDVVVAGAFKKSLDVIGLPMLLWQHKMDEPPIGVVQEMREDAKGLWFKASIPKDQGDPLLNRIGAGLKRRTIKSTSIGYKTAKSERRKSDNVRLLRELKLYEISVVNMPMNPLASIDTVKGMVTFQDLPVLREAKAWDADAAFQRITAKFGTDDDARRAFLFTDGDEAKSWDRRLLIADVGEDGEMVVNPVACFKAVATLVDERAKLDLSEDVKEAVCVHLERYYGALNLESPFKSMASSEFDALTEREREARLTGLGMSKSLAKRIASGRWDADRQPRREDAANKGANELLAALSSIGKAAESLITKRT